jgi:hypothetical protein
MQVKYYFCISISFLSCSSVRSCFLCSSFNIPILNALANSFSCSAVSIIVLLFITTAPLLFNLLYAGGNSYAKLVLIIIPPCVRLIFFHIIFLLFRRCVSPFPMMRILKISLRYFSKYVIIYAHIYISTWNVFRR